MIRGRNIDDRSSANLLHISTVIDASAALQRVIAIIPCEKLEIFSAGCFLTFTGGTSPSADINLKDVTEIALAHSSVKAPTIVSMLDDGTNNNQYFKEFSRDELTVDGQAPSNWSGTFNRGETKLVALAIKIADVQGSPTAIELGVSVLARAWRTVDGLRA